MPILYQKTGLLWQDAQHQEWLAMMHQLKNTEKKANDGKESFRLLCSFIVMYVASHFDLEEAYMGHYDYPERRFHAEEHRLFKLRFKDFKEKYSQGVDQAMDGLVDNMNEWIYSHINENDVKLGQYVLKESSVKR